MDFESALERGNERYASTIVQLRRRAQHQPWFGTTPVPKRQRLLAQSLLDPELLVSLLVSFDVGHHASGWFRNSEYDRCWHLSMSMGNPALGGGGFVDAVPDIVRLWGRLVLGPDLPKAWVEPPAGALDIYRTAPQSRFVTHLRVFVDQKGQAIVPEGEVYTLVPFTDGSSPEKIFR